MKFTKGYWMMKPGVVAYNCEQIRQVRVSADKKSVYLYAVPYRKDERSMDGPTQEMLMTSPMTPLAITRRRAR